MISKLNSGFIDCVGVPAFGQICVLIACEVIIYNTNMFLCLQQYRPRWGYKSKDETKSWLLEVPENAGKTHSACIY